MKWLKYEARKQNSKACHRLAILVGVFASWEFTYSAVHKRTQWQLLKKEGEVSVCRWKEWKKLNDLFKNIPLLLKTLTGGTERGSRHDILKFQVIWIFLHNSFALKIGKRRRKKNKRMKCVDSTTLSPTDIVGPVTAPCGLLYLFLCVPVFMEC